MRVSRPGHRRLESFRRFRVSGVWAEDVEGSGFGPELALDHHSFSKWRSGAAVVQRKQPRERDQNINPKPSLSVYIYI